MACTLDLYTDYLISSTGQTSATGLSRLFDGQLSHDQVTRWLRSVYLDSRQVWAHAKPLVRRAEQALVSVLAFSNRNTLKGLRREENLDPLIYSPRTSQLSATS